MYYIDFKIVSNTIVGHSTLMRTTIKKSYYANDCKDSNYSPFMQVFYAKIALNTVF